MGEWHKTGCVLCAQNCGLEVLVENNKMVKVRPDKDNPRSKGYVCRKGLNAANYHHHADRLTHPLKRHGKGFRKISWDQAIKEISAKLKKIVGDNGPRSLAYMGGGGQGCHFDAFFGIQLLRAMGSRYHYNPLAQELTGYFWVNGRVLGRQNLGAIPHEDDSDMIIAWGWNGMESHQTPRAPIVLKEFAKNPDKLLAAVDPRKSETARIADIHISVRPGTDALLLKAMIAVIIDKGWENTQYIQDHVSGWEAAKPLFKGFDVKKALKVCQLEYAEIEKFCRLLTTRKWCMHSDLGVLMNRHSTATSYLLAVLTAICGRYCVPGGNVIPGTLSPLGFHTDERDPDNWKTLETGFPAISGFHPPNVLPEEIESDNPERIRAVITSSSNPLRSYPDTSAYENAFKKLDLLVTIELSMTETARLADYVLPARSGYESYDGTFFPWTYPEIYFQMRRPIVEPEGERLECGEIFTRLADGLGLIPPIPQSLYEAAKKDRLTYAMEMAAFVQSNPEAIKRLPFIMAKTIGKEMGSAHLSLLWGMLQQMMASYKSPDGKLLDPEEIFLKIADGEGLVPDLPDFLHQGFAKPLAKHLLIFMILLRVRSSTYLEDADRQGFSIAKAAIKAVAPKRFLKIVKTAATQLNYSPLMQLTPTATLSEDLFETIMDTPQGLWIGKSDEDNFKKLKTPDGRIQVSIPKLKDWIKGITPESEEKDLSVDPDYPLILIAGRHMRANANTLMRNPEWNKKLRDCTLLMNPDDVKGLGLEDGKQVIITTEAGSETIELEKSKSARKGQVIMPHGFGLKYDGKVYGANVNRLTKNTHRDPLAATPLHRYVPCRVESC